MTKLEGKHKGFEMLHLPHNLESQVCVSRLERLRDVKTRVEQSGRGDGAGDNTKTTLRQCCRARCLLSCWWTGWNPCSQPLAFEFMLNAIFSI